MYFFTYMESTFLSICGVRTSRELDLHTTDTVDRTRPNDDSQDVCV